MAQPFVLAIEPDLRQAAIVKRVVREKALADIAVVDSRDAAIEAMRTTMPDVLLLSALLSPRDEDELMAHLRTLENAGHLQTHTIPQLASALGPGEGRAARGLLSAFRRKKEPEPIQSGCDPDLFAEEIRVFIQRAADKKKQLLNSGHALPDMRPAATESTRQAVTESTAAGAAPSSSWSSPFEWKPSGGKSSAPVHAPAAVAPDPVVAAEVAAAPPAADPVPVPEPVVLATEQVEAVAVGALEERVVAEPVAPDPVVAQPVVAEPVVADRVADSVVAEAVVAAPHVDPAPLDLPPLDVTPLEAVVEPVVEAAAPPPVAVVDTPEVEIMLDAPHPVEAPRGKPIRERAVKIVAKVKEDTPARTADVFDKSEWTRDRQPAIERLGPLARWARSEPINRTKAAPVTADDVRALMSSLSVPTAVAWVSYPRGVRIRRVRVPAAPEADSTESVGTVILSRRILAEHREKRPSA